MECFFRTTLFLTLLAFFSSPILYSLSLACAAPRAKLASLDSIHHGTTIVLVRLELRSGYQWRLGSMLSQCRPYNDDEQ
jgi:hypothetical protein